MAAPIEALKGEDRDARMPLRYRDLSGTQGRAPVAKALDEYREDAISINQWIVARRDRKFVLRIRPR